MTLSHEAKTHGERVAALADWEASNQGQLSRICADSEHDRIVEVCRGRLGSKHCAVAARRWQFSRFQGDQTSSAGSRERTIVIDIPPTGYSIITLLRSDP